MTKELEQDGEDQLDILQKRYINSFKDYVNKVINNPKLGPEFIETDEMVQFLVVSDALTFHYDEGKQQIIMEVDCNDLFVWGCSDSVEIVWDEIPDLFWMCLEDSKFGSQKWCCKKENRKPQTPFIKWIKKENCWESWMDDLQDSFM